MRQLLRTRPYRIAVDAVAAEDVDEGRRCDVEYDACDDDGADDEVMGWMRTV